MRIVISALVLFPGFAASQQAGAALAGCYTLSLGPWSWTVGDERGYYTPPDTFRLLEGVQATPTIAYPFRSERGRASWRLLPDSSLVIVWSNGFAQAVLTMAPQGSEYRGTLEALSDAHPRPEPPRRLASAVVRPVACGPAMSVSAQAPAGYHIGAPINLPDSLVEVFAGGRFRATVRRDARTADDRAMIALAERLYPDEWRPLDAARDPAERDRLAAMAPGATLPAYKIPPRAPGNAADRWWFDTFDATWTPFAVTGGAVDYYLNRLRDLADGRGQLSFAPGKRNDTGSLDYRATIRPGSEPGVARVVELRISWEYICGSLCALWFTHTRTVYFDARGAVIRVTGDGRPKVIVS